MINSVKVLKPNKDGQLIEVKIIPAKEVSELHWKSVKIDTHRSPYTGGKRLKKNVKYHRIGADRKICIEEGCTKLVEDARRLTCSVKCRNLRANRQKKVHIEKENNSKVTCKSCGSIFIARKDRRYCSKKCRYKRS